MKHLPLGFYKIVYTAKDSSNNSTQAFRLIEYVDETEPIIILLGDITNKYDIGADPAELFVEPGYQINDYYWQPENVTVTIENFSITEPLITINHSLDNLLQI